MTRVILCPVGEWPHVACLDADPAAATRRRWGGCQEFQSRLPLLDVVELCCNGDGLLYGFSLARGALATPPAALPRFESAIRFDRLQPVLDPDVWPISADFLLARVVAGSGLADLTTADCRFWMFWLGPAGEDRQIGDPPMPA